MGGFFLSCRSWCHSVGRSARTRGMRRPSQPRRTPRASQVVQCARSQEGVVRRRGRRREHRCDRPCRKGAARFAARAFVDLRMASDSDDAVTEAYHGHRRQPGRTRSAHAPMWCVSQPDAAIATPKIALPSAPAAFTCRACLDALPLDRQTPRLRWLSTTSGLVDVMRSDAGRGGLVIRCSAHKTGARPLMSGWVSGKG